MKRSEKKNTATVYIYPLNEDDEPGDKWLWEAEIEIPTKGSYKLIFGSNSPDPKNPTLFPTIQSAFDWTYKWLDDNGYEVSNPELTMNDKSHQGLRKK